MQPQISSPADLIKALRSRQEMAEDVGVSLDAVHKWVQRNRIPTEHQGSALRAARKQGLRLSADNMLSIHALNRVDDASAVQPPAVPTEENRTPAEGAP